jgi:glycosyltransferase involved in cell wall biosynthesis
MVELSVITINFNDAEGLERTIQSVAGQAFRNREYIVIDGGSTDGSREVIKRHASDIDQWVSEKDKGIYNAQNKGIARATGNYCLFLNSGDVLKDHTVLERIFSEQQSADIVYGDMCIDWGNGKITHGKMPDTITKEQLFTDTLWHPVSFIKRSLFEKYGMYDESYRMVADYEFFFRTIIAHGVQTKHVGVEVCTYNVNGFSSRPEFKEIEMAERKKVQERYLSPEEIMQLGKKFGERKVQEGWIRRRYTID